MKGKVNKYIMILMISVMMSGSVVTTTEIYAQNNEIKQSVSTKASVKIIATGTGMIDGVSVRSTNSASGKYLGTIYTDQKVNILQKMSNGWYKIQYKNGTAYVSKTFIKLDNTSTTTNTVLNTGSVYNTTTLTVNKTASTSGTKLGTLKKGAKVEIVDATSTNWYKIKYNKTYGYVSSKYIKLTASVKVINTGSVYNATTLNVRKTTSTSSTKLGSLKKGQIVKIVKKESNGWYKIIYNNGYGYVSNSYIKLNSTSSKVDRKNLDNFLFVGDSFTNNIRNVITVNNNISYVHAQGGSRPSYWLDKVGDMPSNNSIDGISLLIGVNGIVNPGRDLDKTIKDAKTLINKLIVKYPDKTIYVQKVFPVGSKFETSSPATNNKLIKEYNKQMEAYCKTKSNLKFINTTSGFVNSSGYMINTTDGLHVATSKNSTYYKNIFNAIKVAEKK